MTTDSPDTKNNCVTMTTNSLNTAGSCVTMTTDSLNTTNNCVTLTTNFLDTMNNNVTMATKQPDAKNKSITKMSALPDNFRSPKRSKGAFFHAGALTSPWVTGTYHFRSSSLQGACWMWLLASIFLYQITPGHGSGYLVVQFLKYENPTRHLASGFCCDEAQKECVSKMQCDHIFYTCLSDPKVQTTCSLSGGSAEFLEGPSQESVFNFPGFPYPDRVMQSFDRWPGSAEIKITVKEWDNRNKALADLVDNFTYTYSASKLTQDSAAPSSTVELVGSRATSKTKLKLKIWAYCEKLWFGANCDKQCAESDSCEQGHYTCDADGQKVCRKGWGGTDCKTRVPEESKCSDYKGLPESVWTTSYTCATKPYTLTMNITSITNLKFTGTILAVTGSLSGRYKLEGDQTKRDEIVIKDNGWITMDVKHVESFQFVVGLSKDGTSLSGTAASAGCSVSGITLTRTEVTPAECSKWGSNCWKYGDTYEKFSCCCQPGFRGQRCEIPPDLCAPNPCKNSGKCTTLLDYTGFKCECTKGFYGKTCSKTSKDVPCDPDPCLNGGTCFWDSTTGSRCRCKDFFEGNYCETRSDKTVPPCPSYYYGPDCKIYCRETNSCDGHYQCNVKAEKVCYPKWVGTNCSQHETVDDTVKLEHCPDGKICQNKGVCFNKACCCSVSFKGKYCEIPVSVCDSHPCKNGATCVDKNGAYGCNCVKGYHGDNCEKIVDYCEPKPCKNGGVCELLLPPGTGYRCRCTGRWFGTACETPGSFMTCNPCKNKATCIYTQSYGFKCDCLAGSVGELCEATAPGQPTTFGKVSRTDQSLTLAWRPPSINYGHVQNYEVTCTPFYSYNPVVLNEKAKYSRTQSLTWRNTTSTIKDLEPGTTYNCSIRASTLAGYGSFNKKTIATRPGKPNLAVIPKLEYSKMTATTVHISIPSFSFTTGPISAFRIVVQMVSAGRLKKRSVKTKTNFNDVLHIRQRYMHTSDVLHRKRRDVSKELTQEQIDTLTDYGTAKNKDLTHYIAAEYTQPESSFIVGDNQRYGKYLNAPLKEGVKYGIFFGVISTLDGESEEVYVSLGDPVTVEAVAGEINWRIGLGVGVALIVLAFIFILVMIFVCKDMKKDGTKSEIDSEPTDTPESRRRKNKLKGTPTQSGSHLPGRTLYRAENGQNPGQNGSRSHQDQSDIQNPTFDHEHQMVYGPIGHASDAYTLQKRLSSEQRRMTGNYEINYNDSMSQFGKFDNKGFVGDARC